MAEPGGTLDNQTIGSGSGSGPGQCDGNIPPSDWRKTPPFTTGNVIGSGVIGLGGSITGSWIWVVTNVCPVFGTVEAVITSPVSPPSPPAPPAPPSPPG